MKISKQDFGVWKMDPITNEFFLALGRLRDRIEEQMLSDSVISNPNGLLTLNRLAGIREGIDQVLFLSVEDFADDDNEEKSETGRVSSISEIEEGRAT